MCGLASGSWTNQFTVIICHDHWLWLGLCQWGHIVCVNKCKISWLWARYTRVKREYLTQLGPRSQGKNQSNDRTYNWSSGQHVWCIASGQRSWPVEAFASGQTGLQFPWMYVRLSCWFSSVGVCDYVYSVLWLCSVLVVSTAVKALCWPLKGHR